MSFTLPAQGNIPKIAQAQNSTSTFELTSGVAWNVAAAPMSWCRVSPTSGMASNTAANIVVTATTANTNTVTRDCTLTFMVTGTSSKTRTVTQNGRVSFDVPASISAMSGAANSTSTFSLTSSAAWSIAAAPTSWCSVSPTSGRATGPDGSITITVTAKNQNPGVSRDCTLTFMVTGGSNQTRTVTQNKYVRFDLPASSILIMEGNELQKTFQLTSGADWTVRASSARGNWCRVSPTFGSASTAAVTITIQTAENWDSARDCTLTFTVTSLTPNPTITVRQKRNSGGGGGG